ncbi:MAG: hypothetical protein K2F87_02160 [Muribaculaceae bacterium]|nr:hypothetical protein [Muribaculaceae bacterium]
MKKSISFFLFLALCTSVQANELQILSCGVGTPGADEPQLLGLSISPDGHYICGPLEMGNGFFAADRITGEVKWSPSADAATGAEMRHIDNNGLAIGYAATGLTFNYLTGEETPLLPPEGYREIIGEALTNDGSVMVGGMSTQSFTTIGAWSTDGVNWEELPIPGLDELGPLGAGFVGKGSSAKQISGDGKVIFGFIGSFGLPMAWILNDEGKYEPDCFVSRYVKSSLDEDSKPLYGISGMYLSISNNGRYLCMQGLLLTEDEDELRVPVIYDTQSKELTIFYGQQDIDEYGVGLYPISIADDGTFIGTIGQPYFGSMGSFIWEAGKEQPRTFMEAFPEYAEKLGEADGLGFNMPTSLSANGRYLLGYTYYCEDYYNSDSAAYYLTYVIDRSENVGADRIAADPAEPAVEGIFNIDGRRTSGLNRGINVVRMSDGTSRKILVR